MTAIKIVILVFSLMISVNYSYALTITSLWGDQDSFDGKVTSDPFVWWMDLNNEGPTLDDVRFSGEKSWTHNYILPNNFSITSVSFEIFHGGDGSEGHSPLSINGNLIGNLTQVDGYSTFLDTFNIPSNLLSIFMNGSAAITVSPVAGYHDEWALDYSKLTITGSQVPIPSSLLLLGSSILGLGVLRRFRKN